MTLRLIVSFFAASALICAQAPGPDTMCVLEGKVLSLSGEPLRKATLHLRAAPGSSANYSVSSDATGKFVFDDIEPGRYSLSAERTGYVPQFFGATQHPSKIMRQWQRALPRLMV